MTAATDPTAAAQGGGPLSEAGPQAAHGGPAEGRSATSGQPVPTAPAATRATAVGTSRPVVPLPRPERPAAVISDGSATAPAATVATVSQQVGAAERDDGRSTSDSGAPVPATPVAGGSKIRQLLADLGPAGAGRGPLPDGLRQRSASAVEAGSELSAEAYVEALDGSERTILLRHIARAFPDAVEAGVVLVAEWRAECAERRRVAARRREHDKRRERRRQS